MKKFQEHLLQLFGGAVICMMVISFLGLVFQMGSKVNEVVGPWGLVIMVTLSYISGWAFLRKLDDRVKRNSKPHMIHYQFDRIDKRDDSWKA